MIEKKNFFFGHFFKYHQLKNNQQDLSKFYYLTLN